MNPPRGPIIVPATEQRCVYCGRPTKRRQAVCGFHSDLPALDDYAGLHGVRSPQKGPQGR